MKYLLRPIATLAVAVLFTACKKEWNELGSQLVVSDDLELFSFDDQEIKISVVKEDSLRSLNSSTSYIGYLNDPILVTQQHLCTQNFASPQLMLISVPQRRQTLLCYL